MCTIFGSIVYHNISCYCVFVLGLTISYVWYFLLICSVYCCSILAIGNCLFVSLAVLIVANHISHHHFYSATILIQRQVNSKFISNHDSNWKVKQPFWHLHTLCQYSCILQDTKYGQKASYLPYYYYQRIGSSPDPITQVPKQCPQCIFLTLQHTIIDDMTLMQWKVKKECYQRWM